jgi:NAD(P)-dependent dehydrogenase (short-subunit alcohol dehydrogenase family)
MNCVLLGAKSDIGAEIGKRLTADGWSVWGWARGDSLEGAPKWDLIVCAIGSLKPIGNFFDTEWLEWHAGFNCNVMVPLRLIHSLYHLRNPEASVCVFGGTNPFKHNPRYSAYASSKAALRMAVRDISSETDLRIFMLDTGYVKTKIHQEPNDRTESTSHEDIYTVLQKCLKVPKVNVTGQSFYVPNCSR